LWLEQLLRLGADLAHGIPIIGRFYGMAQQVPEQLAAQGFQPLCLEPGICLHPFEALLPGAAVFAGQVILVVVP